MFVQVVVLAANFPDFLIKSNIVLRKFYVVLSFEQWQKGVASTKSWEWEERA